MIHYIKFLLTVFLIANHLITGQASEQTVEISLVTSHGTIGLLLYADKAPITVNNFLKYVDAGLYNNGAFKRTVRHDNDNGDPKITVIQGGANTDVSLYAAITLETTMQTGILHTDGVISMARGEPDTAQAEFFITIGS